MQMRGHVGHAFALQLLFLQQLRVNLRWRFGLHRGTGRMVALPFMGRVPVHQVRRQLLFRTAALRAFINHAVAPGRLFNLIAKDYLVAAVLQKQPGLAEWRRLCRGRCQQQKQHACTQQH
jgi:hypothetical protein